jgi:uncharacterized membrane protein YhaH (DUF805 family)
MDKTPTQWMIEPLRKYATFEGRARRKEFWWFELFVFLVSFALVLAEVAVVGFDAALESSFGPSTLFTLAILIPGLAVTFRRLHDIDRSAWWMLIIIIPFIGAIILLVWNCQRGTIGANRYGPDPVGAE